MKPTIRARTILFALALALTACEAHPSVFAPAGPASRSIATLGGWVTGIFCVVAVVVIGLVAVAAFRRRGTLETHEPFDAGGGHKWILIGGFAVPSVILAVIFVATLGTIDRFPLHDGEHYRPDIRVVGRQWWWEVQYVGDKTLVATTANEIHVPLGWPVEIELESRDVIHSFWVPALHGKVDLVPGRKNRIRIVADEAGRYEGQCAEYCGLQHSRMMFAVVAEPMEDYQRWLAHQAEPAKAPSSPEAARGLELFETKACGLCHTVRGSRAGGGVGPDLTHLASRQGIAANSYPRSRAYLQAWITHAQSLKPGNQMPNVTAMTGDELNAIATYLEGLQ